MARGQQDPPRQGLALTLRVGLVDGHVRPGYLPCEVLVENHGLAKQVEVRLEVAGRFESEGRAWTRRVGLSPGQQRRLWFVLPVETGGFEVRGVVHELSDGGVVGRRLASGTVKINLSFGSLATIGQPNVVYVRDPQDEDDEDTAGAWFYEGREGASLPDHPLAYDCTDLVVLHAVDCGQLDRLQAEALLSWVATGGQIALVPGAERTWFEQPLIVELLGGRRFQAKTTRGFPRLAEALGRFRRPPAVPVFVPQGWTPSEAPVPVGERPRWAGRSSLFPAGLPVELAEDGTDYPLLHRLRHGRGSVYVWAFDPSSVAFKGWKHRGTLFAEFLHWTDIRTAARWRSRYNDTVNPVRRTELVEQLDSREPPDTPFVIGLALLYVVCVGPLSYALLGRRRRRELLVLTVPGLSLLFTLAVFGYGYSVGGLGAVTWQVDMLRGTFGGRWAWERSAASLRAAIEPRHEVVLGAGLVGGQIARGIALEQQRWNDREPPEPLLPLTHALDDAGARIPVELERWEQRFFSGQRIHDLGAGITVARDADGAWVVHNRSRLTLARGLFFGDDYARPWAIPAVGPEASARLRRQLPSLPSATPNFRREHVARELWPDDARARELGIAMLEASTVHAPRNAGASSVLFAALEGVPQSLVVDGREPNHRVSLLVLETVR